MSDPPPLTCLCAKLLAVDAMLRVEDKAPIVVIWVSTEPRGGTERLALPLSEVDELIEGLRRAQADHSED